MGDELQSNEWKEGWEREDEWEEVEQKGEGEKGRGGKEREGREGKGKGEQQERRRNAVS